MKYLFAIGIFFALASPTSAATITPDTVSSNYSKLAVDTTTVLADGVHKATITVTVRNFSDISLANKSVFVFNALSAGPIAINPAEGTLSDEYGKAIFTLASTTPGDAIIRASLAGSILETHVTFVAPVPCEFASYQLVKSRDNSAVYYSGKDCKRHAFPDEKTYFTWYKDFESVTTLTPADIAKMPLGKNVTHRPGYRMIKFPSINKVYAISRGGVLHWVTTEQLAEALYGPYGLNEYPPGSAWNQKVDDVSEAFFSNYSVGSEIHTVTDVLHTDYNPTSELANVKTIDDNW